jgi:hypothetical protein
MFVKKSSDVYSSKYHGHLNYYGSDIPMYGQTNLQLVNDNVDQYIVCYSKDGGRKTSWHNLYHFTDVSTAANYFNKQIEKQYLPGGEKYENAYLKYVSLGNVDDRLISRFDLEDFDVRLKDEWCWWLLKYLFIIWIFVLIV